MGLNEYLAIPFIIAVSSVKGADSKYVCRVELPELGQCAAEAPSILEAIDLLEARKTDYIKVRLDRGEKIPIPRAPLKDLV